MAFKCLIVYSFIKMFHSTRFYGKINYLTSTRAANSIFFKTEINIFTENGCIFLLFSIESLHYRKHDNSK